MEDCDGSHVARGLCWKHLQRYYRHGDAATVLPRGGDRGHKTDTDKGGDMEAPV